MCVNIAVRAQRLLSVKHKGWSHTETKELEGKLEPWTLTGYCTSRPCSSSNKFISKKNF